MLEQRAGQPPPWPGVKVATRALTCSPTCWKARPAVAGGGAVTGAGIPLGKHLSTLLARKNREEKKIYKKEYASKKRKLKNISKFKKKQGKPSKRDSICEQKWYFQQKHILKWRRTFGTKKTTSCRESTKHQKCKHHVNYRLPFLEAVSRWWFCD